MILRAPIPSRMHHENEQIFVSSRHSIDSPQNLEEL
jgi:hypothetical protein